MHTAATIAMINRRFAGHEQAVERAFGASESFRGLCRDYLACATALARWQESDSDEAQLRVREYSDLLAELTSEIQSQLRVEEQFGNPPSQGEVSRS